MSSRRLSFPSITAKKCIWVLHRTHQTSLSRWSLALRHQSLAFRTRLYAKLCREWSAWGGGCIRAYVWGILRMYTAEAASNHFPSLKRTEALFASYLREERIVWITSLCSNETSWKYQRMFNLLALGFVFCCWYYFFFSVLTRIMRRTLITDYSLVRMRTIEFLFLS